MRWWEEEKWGEKRNSENKEIIAELKRKIKKQKQTKKHWNKQSKKDYDKNKVQVQYMLNLIQLRKHKNN